MHGYGCPCQVVWDDINLQDLLEEAKAGGDRESLSISLSQSRREKVYTCSAVSSSRAKRLMRAMSSLSGLCRATPPGSFLKRHL